MEHFSEEMVCFYNMLKPGFVPPWLRWRGCLGLNEWENSFKRHQPKTVKLDVWGKKGPPQTSTLWTSETLQTMVIERNCTLYPVVEASVELQMNVSLFGTTWRILSVFVKCHECMRAMIKISGPGVFRSTFLPMIKIKISGEHRKDLGLSQTKALGHTSSKASLL